MSFDSWAEFFAMGGHGLYVWLSYGTSVLVVLANVLGVTMARRRYFRDARALQRRAATAAASPMNDQAR
jgi:heme exporter protein D